MMKFSIKPIHFILIAISFLTMLPDSFAQQMTKPDDIRSKMKWFSDAKLGIFIHWGIYSVNGVGESWSFHNKEIAYDEYMKQINGFTASKYDPAYWASLVEKSGAKYAVITTKHHDGVALFNTQFKERSIPEHSPAGRDLITPFFNELRNRNLKCGAYFSLLDWSHPDYPGFLKDSSRYVIKDNPAKWTRFLDFNNTQIAEISSQLNPDLYWFDGDWEHIADEWHAADLRQMILARNPDAIINGRLAGYGDYDTPEQNIPITRPVYPWWELCMTINNQWGWQPNDKAWKSPYEIITLFVDVIGVGGNLLLDIGPKEDGSIPEEQINVLTELGTWISRNKESVYGTTAGLPNGFFHGASTLSADSTELFLFVHGKDDVQVVLKGLNNKILSANILGTNSTVIPKIVGKISWSTVPGRVFLSIPSAVRDPYMTVIKLKLDGKISLYTGRGGFH